MPALPDPEAAWEVVESLNRVEASEVEARLGRLEEPFQILSGGQANASLLIGQDKVLRIFRRDASQVAKEAALLRGPWKAFIAPEVLRQGADFLLLRRVEHGPLEDSAAHGRAIGRALAEIHGRTYPQAGFLDGSLSIQTPFTDFVANLSGHIFSFLDGAEAAPFTGLRDRFVRFFAAQAGGMAAVAGSPVLLHGDFKVSNLHWTPRGLPLVLDWEFAYAGSPLMDLGQLFRWDPSPEFRAGFEEAYAAAGRGLPPDWPRWAAYFDLANLIGLLRQVPPDSRRARDVLAKIMHTLALAPGSV